MATLYGIHSYFTSWEYDVRVLDDGTGLEVLLNWPKNVMDTVIGAHTPWRAGCVLEESEIVKFNAAALKVRTSSHQSIESKGDYSSALSDGYKNTCAIWPEFVDHGSLFSLIFLIVHKE